ncbi:MAG: hypothetical protein RPU32_08400 [Candidatus Sedimenticola sp. (ex Thyasira tokunagai)]
MISYKKRLKYKYTLHDAYSHPDPTGIEVVKAIDQKMLDLDEDGRLTIHKGYSWDGATSTPDSASIMKGSLVHDALYQLMREEKIGFDQRLRADQLLREICIDSGMFKPYAWWVFWAVRLFGACNAMPDLRRAP